MSCGYMTWICRHTGSVHKFPEVYIYIHYLMYIIYKNIHHMHNAVDVFDLCSIYIERYRHISQCRASLRSWTPRKSRLLARKLVMAVSGSVFVTRCDQWIPNGDVRDQTWDVCMGLGTIWNNTRPHVCQIQEWLEFLRQFHTVCWSHHRSRRCVMAQQTTRGSRTCPHIPAIHRTFQRCKHFVLHLVIFNLHSN